MAKYPKMTITNAGLDMIAESAADAKALIFTRVKLGDGSLTTQSIMDLTELVNEKMTVELSSGEAQAGGQTKLRFAVSNSGLDEGFFAREIGLYAKVGEDGAEGLYAYTNGASYVDYIPDKSNPLDAQVVDIYVVTANASSIKIEVSSAAYATVQDLVDHNAGVNSHPHGLTAPLMIWESGEIYKVNDVRVHEKKIWMCITANSDVTFDKAKWENIGGGGGGLPLGFIFWTSAPVEMEGVLVANGAELSRAMYPDLNALYASKNYPWGDGDGSTTFNLPNLIGRFAEGASVAGGYHSAGLPNIEGSNDFSTQDDAYGISYGTTGAFRVDNPETKKRPLNGSTGSVDRFGEVLYFDASLSNPIYGNSNTVQPPSALLIPYVVVFTEQTAGSALIDVTQYASELANKANRSLSNIDSNIDYVVDSYSDVDGNWWRKYKSGWIEQGGYITMTVNTSSLSGSYNLLKPYIDSNYFILLSSNFIYNGSTAGGLGITDKTDTMFTVTYKNMLSTPCGWYACGQGAIE